MAKLVQTREQSRLDGDAGVAAVAFAVEEHANLRIESSASPLN